MYAAGYGIRPLRSRHAGHTRLVRQWAIPKVHKVHELFPELVKKR